MGTRVRGFGDVERLRTLPLAAGATLLALVVADSTARAGWVSGAVALPAVAMLGAMGGSVVALSRVRGHVGLALALAPAPVASFLLVASQNGVALTPRTVMSVVRGALAGVPGAEPIVLLFLLHALFWVLGAWLAWGVVRRPHGLLAVGPAGAALATNVLNYPDGQDAYVFWFIVLTLALLLWSNYHASLAAARRRQVELADNARWDFWERGALAAAGLVVLGVLVPPLSVTDRTNDIQSGLTDAWGRVTHTSAGATTSIGFSADARLGGALARETAVVLTYAVDGDAPGPSYFHGLDLQPARREWAFVPRAAGTQRVTAGQEVVE